MRPLISSRIGLYELQQWLHPITWVFHKRTREVEKSAFLERRTQENIDQLRRGLSTLERKEKNQGNRIKGLAHIKNKFNVKRDERRSLKQWVKPKAAKQRRFKQRVSQYRQNRMFQYDQKRLHQELDGVTDNSDILPDPQESCDFLGKESETLNDLMFMDDLKLYGKKKGRVDSLVNTVRVFSNDIGMEFGLEKCGILILKRGKVEKAEGITLPDGCKMKSLEEDGYKYLGVLEYETYYIDV